MMSLLLLASLAFAQTPSTPTAQPLLPTITGNGLPDPLKITLSTGPNVAPDWFDYSNLRIWVTELQKGKPTLTSVPTYQKGLQWGSPVSTLTATGAETIAPAQLLTVSSMTTNAGGQVVISTSAQITGQLSIGWQRVTNACGSASACTVTCPAGTQILGMLGQSGCGQPTDETSTATSVTYNCGAAASMTATAICGRLQL